jgi:hypothetical protein
MVWTCLMMFFLVTIDATSEVAKSKNFGDVLQGREIGRKKMSIPTLPPKSMKKQRRPQKVFGRGKKQKFRSISATWVELVPAVADCPENLSDPQRKVAINTYRRGIERAEKTKAEQ